MVLQVPLFSLTFISDHSLAGFRDIFRLGSSADLHGIRKINRNLHLVRIRVDPLEVDTVHQKTHLPVIRPDRHIDAEHVQDLFIDLQTALLIVSCFKIRDFVGIPTGALYGLKLLDVSNISVKKEGRV